MAKSITVVITDKVGLHARPASQLAKEASKYESAISIMADGKKGNLKSIMNVMAMAIKTGQEVVVEADGSDAEAAIAGIEKVMKDTDLIAK